MKTKVIYREPQMPVFEVPESFGTLSQYRAKYGEEELMREFNSSPSEYDRLGGYEGVLKIKFQSDYLYVKTFAGAQKRWGDPIPDEVRSRLEYELDVIAHLGCAAYILIMADCIEAVRRQGILVGPCRGAASGSAILYALGVSSVDPLKYDLMFERFLNPARIMMPDIDVELEVDGCKKVVEYIAKKYGSEHAALVPLEPEDPRQGVVISEIRLAEFLPLVDGEGDALLRSTECGSRWVEAAGGVRFDFIGMESLTELRQSLDAVEKETGNRPDIDQIPFDDWRDKALDYALRSPHLAEQRAKIEKRREGHPVTMAHPILEGVLYESHGVLVYQEQVIFAMRRLAGLTRAEADCAYKGMKLGLENRSRKYRPLFIKGCLVNMHFRIGKCVDETKAVECAESIWNKMLLDAPKTFSRAQAISHAKLEAQISYLNAHALVVKD